MKAIIQTEYGSTPEEVLLLGEIARPAAIGEEEILVRVHAAVWTGAPVI
jgi:NADPH:quinone reductase-like Zn-dependent oxidoreductase